MKTKHILLFASTLTLLLTGCKKDPVSLTTSIKGKVVTFREDALHYDGPIDVTLRFSFGDSPRDPIQTKTIYPPYEYEFITDTTHNVWEWFVVDVDTKVPQHKTYYAGDGQILDAGETYEVTTNLMPKTAIRYELINENPQPGDFIALNRIGGGAFTVYSSYQVVIDEGWYNGAYPLHYNVSRNGEADFRIDTIQLSAFDTTYYTIRY